MLHEEDEDRSSRDREAVEPALAAIEPDDVWEEAESNLPAPSLSGAWCRGAMTGVRWTSYIIGPIAAMMLFPGLLLIEFGLGTGHGFGLPDFVPIAVGFYLVSALCGGLVGSVFGLRKGLIARARSGRLGTSWWTSANRPIRLFRWRAKPGRKGDAGPEGRRPSILASSWSGAKAGLRWTLYIAGSISALVMFVGIGLIELHLAPGFRMELPAFIASSLFFPLLCSVYGTIVGAVIGLVVGLIRWMLHGKIGRSRTAMADRPIRLFRRRRNTPAPTGPSRSTALRRRWPYLLGIPLQLAMMVALGAGTYLRWKVDARLADAKSAAEEDDPSWRLDDLMAQRDPVPYAENSATVVAEALELLPENWPNGPASPAGTPRPPSSGAREAYDRLNETEDNVRPDGEAVDTIRNELEKYREAVQIARTVTYYDRGRHELEIGPSIIDTLLPETQASRNVARLLAADAAIRSLDGDLDGALDSCRAMLNTGRSIGDEPFLISQLVRIAIGSVAMRSTRRVLGQGEPSEAALARLQGLILDELAQPLLLYGLRGERAGMFEMIRRIRDGEVPISALSNEHGTPDPGGSRSAIAPWGKLMYDYQMAMVLEWLNDAVAISQSSVDEQPARWKEWDARIVQAKGLWHSAYTSTLSVLMMPAITSSTSAFPRYDAELGATAILLAAERHRRRTGAWPASIAEIDEEILPDPPLDPFTGQPFRMEHRDGRLFIHSIGPNGRDEHGAYEPRKWSTGGPDDVGAIGWDVDLRRQPATAGEEPSR
jgi:hypothetical protein